MNEKEVGCDWSLTLKVYMKDMRSAEEKILDAGYEGVKYLTDYSYDTALIGVSEDGRAIYDYMI